MSVNVARSSHADSFGLGQTCPPCKSDGGEAGCAVWLPLWCVRARIREHPHVCAQKCVSRVGRSGFTV